MTLSGLPQEFADEMRLHHWSDSMAPRPRWPQPLNRFQPWVGCSVADEADRVRMNVPWVAAQVLGHADPNFDPCESMEQAGVAYDLTHNRDGKRSGGVTAGLRRVQGKYARPGTFDFD